MAQEEKEDKDKASGSRLKTIIIIVVAAILAAALSVGGTLFFLSDGASEDDEAETAQEQEDEHVPAAYVSIDRPLRVGIAGEHRQRYVQVHLALVMRGDDLGDELERHKPAIRSRLQSVLQREEFAALHTNEGKEALQETMLVAVNDVLEQEGVAPVENVLFTNFVMQ